MLKAALVFAVAAVAFATVAPKLFLDQPDSAPVPMAAATVAAPAPIAAAPAPGYREAVLRADPRGQYAADVLVNGIQIRMLVDTGASFVALSSGAAARLGLPISGAKLKMRTANGINEASPVRLNAVSLDRLYMTDVQAVVMPAAAGDINLLGASFLKRLLSVEQRNGYLLLRQ